MTLLSKTKNLSPPAMDYFLKLQLEINAISRIPLIKFELTKGNIYDKA
jgi:hypothetical protein